MGLSPDQARELAQSGAALLMLDVPAGTVVGIDQQVPLQESVSRTCAQAFKQATQRVSCD